MKIKDKEKLHQSSKQELLQKLTQEQKLLTELRLKLKAGKLKDVRALRKKRQEIAVIKTILRHKELNQ